MKMLGKFTFLEQPIIITSIQGIKSYSILSSHPTRSLLPVLKLLLSLAFDLPYKKIGKGTIIIFYLQQPSPKPTLLASIVCGINKPSIFELQTIITHPTLEASQNPTKGPIRR